MSFTLFDKISHDHLGLVRFTLEKRKMITMMSLNSFFVFVSQNKWLIWRNTINVSCFLLYNCNPRINFVKKVITFWEREKNKWDNDTWYAENIINLVNSRLNLRYSYPSLIAGFALMELTEPENQNRRFT